MVVTHILVALIIFINIASTDNGKMCIWNSSYALYGFSGLYIEQLGQLHNNKPYYTQRSSCDTSDDSTDWTLAYFKYSDGYQWGVAPWLIDNQFGGRCTNNGSTPNKACGEPGHFTFHGGNDQYAFIIPDSCPDINCSIINITDLNIDSKCRGVFIYDKYLQLRKKSFPKDIIWWFNIGFGDWVCTGEDEIGYLTYKRQPQIDFTVGDCSSESGYAIHGFYEIYKWCISISNQISNQISNGVWSSWTKGTGYPFWWSGNHFRLETVGTHYNYINQICVSNSDSIDGIQVNFTDGNHSVLGGTNINLSCFHTKPGQCFAAVSVIVSDHKGIVQLTFTTSDGEWWVWQNGQSGYVGERYQFQYELYNCITKMEFYSNNYVQRIRFYFESFNITYNPTYNPSYNPTYNPSYNPSISPSFNPTVSYVPDVSATVATEKVNNYNSTQHSVGNKKLRKKSTKIVSMIVVAIVIILICASGICYCFHRKNKMKQQLISIKLESTEANSTNQDKNELLIVKEDIMAIEAIN